MFDRDAFMARLAGPPQLMGILNVTPDSFSDGGKFNQIDVAVAHAVRMAAEGADIIDIGGESTRPGYQPISAKTEQARILPVVREVRAAVNLPISIDTYKAETARAAIDAGADILNDVWGLQRGSEMAALAADTGRPIICMHNRDTVDPDIDIHDDIKRFLSRSLEIANDAGVSEGRIILDPGFGFGKTIEQSLAILARIDEFKALGFPLLVGLSRKGFIGHYSGNSDKSERLAGTLAANATAVAAGAAQIIRVHDVKPHREMLDFMAALQAARPSPGSG